MEEMFSYRLKKMREELNLTQQELANKSTIKRSSISHWENGTAIPNIAKMKPLTQALGVSMDFLLGLDTKTIGASSVLMFFMIDKFKNKKKFSSTEEEFFAYLDYYKKYDRPESLNEALGKIQDYVNNQEKYSLETCKNKKILHFIYDIEPNNSKGFLKQIEDSGLEINIKHKK